MCLSTKIYTITYIHTKTTLQQLPGTREYYSTTQAKTAQTPYCLIIHSLPTPHNTSFQPVRAIINTNHQYLSYFMYRQYFSNVRPCDGADERGASHTAFSPPKCSKPSSSASTCNRPFSPVPNNQPTYLYSSSRLPLFSFSFTACLITNALSDSCTAHPIH